MTSTLQKSLFSIQTSVLNYVMFMLRSEGHGNSMFFTKEKKIWCTLHSGT